MDDHVVERAGPCSPASTPAGGRPAASHSATSAATSWSRRVWHLLLRPAALWSSGSSPATRPRRGPPCARTGHARSSPGRRAPGPPPAPRQRRPARSPGLRPCPLVDEIHGNTQSLCGRTTAPECRRRSARGVGVDGGDVRVRALRRRPARGAADGHVARRVRGARGRQPGAVGLRAGQGSGVRPRGAGAERVDRSVRTGTARLTEASSICATSSTSTSSRASPSPCAAVSAVGEHHPAERAAGGDLVGAGVDGLVERFTLIRLPMFSSIHMRAPPAPQQKDRSAWRGISASSAPGRRRAARAARRRPGCAGPGSTGRGR